MTLARVEKRGAEQPMAEEIRHNGTADALIRQRERAAPRLELWNAAYENPSS